MKRSLLALGLGLALAATAQAADIRLVIHGGPATMAREDFTPARDPKYHEGLQQAKARTNSTRPSWTARRSPPAPLRA